MKKKRSTKSSSIFLKNPFDFLMAHGNKKMCCTGLLVWIRRKYFNQNKEKEISSQEHNVRLVKFHSSQYLLLFV